MEYGKKFSEYIEEQNKWKRADERCRFCKHYYTYGTDEMCKVRDDVYPYGRFKKPVTCDVYERSRLARILPLIFSIFLIFIFLMIVNEILGAIL